MCCDKAETVRILSLYLKETQAQYNDCFSEAAEQGTLLELQRDAVQNLQGTIICKDLVYYSLLIKAQELFRGRIQDVRVVKSKIDGLVKSKRYLEEKYRRIKRLWRDADRELRKIKCVSLCEGSSEKESPCKDCSTWTDAVEFGGARETQVQVNFLLRENEELKKQLRNRRLEFELFDREVKSQLKDNNRTQEVAKETTRRLQETENCLALERRQLELVLKEHLAYARILIAELQLARERETMRTDSTTSAPQANIEGPTIKDELRRRNVELDKLINEARDKQQELGMLQDMRKEFERTEDLEMMNECLKRELTILRQAAENDGCCCVRGKERDNRDPKNDEALHSHDRLVNCNEAEHPSEKEVEMIKKLKEQLFSTRELTEECLAELRASKEMLCFLRERICSLKRLLNEKSDEMATLQTDHQMIKNDYYILKTENCVFEEKARAEIREFREKLKALQTELHLVDDDYQRVSRDFDKSQALLIEAARREVNLQHAITAMEQIFYTKLASTEKEGKRLSALVDVLRSDLENTREELSSREVDYTETCRDAYGHVEMLEESVALLEDGKRHLTRQLQECRLENCRLVEENNRLKDNGCICVKELEDTHNALLELKGECKTKSKTLDCVSAELNHVAASRSELCDESQRVVACIRSWVDEQRRLVETLSKKLKDEKKRIAQFAFEKKALLATVRELTLLDGASSESPSTRRNRCVFSGHSPIRRSSRTNLDQTLPLRYSSQRGTPRRAQRFAAAGSTVYTRPLKRRCVCLTRTARRTSLRGNSWWFPKLEHVSKELCGKKRRHAGKITDGWQSETSMDETRDFGYQSSASK